MDHRKVLGERVRKFREARKQDLDWLSAESGVPGELLLEVEAGAATPTVIEIIDIAEALDVPAGALLDPPHPLEAEMRCSAHEIMEAIRRGHRAKVDVRGKLAEYFLWNWLTRLSQETPDFALKSWNDKDGEPDFDVEWKGRSLRVECKNVRSLSPTAPTRQLSPIRVELQKTRNSQDGTPTRGYRFTEFQVLAACLFNRAGEWRYVYCATRLLRPRSDHPELLQVMQEVPNPARKPWSAEIRHALDDAVSTE